MKSCKEAFEDAISATKAAMAEGIAPGGGLPLLRAIDAVEKVIRIALDNAVSVASVLLLTEATLTEVPEKEAKAPPGFEGGIE